jgi:hypothetical protein
MKNVLCTSINKTEGVSIVLDCTTFFATNVLPISWMTQLLVIPLCAVASLGSHPPATTKCQLILKQGFLSEWCNGTSTIAYASSSSAPYVPIIHHLTPRSTQGNVLARQAWNPGGAYASARHHAQSTVCHWLVARPDQLAITSRRKLAMQKASQS